MPDLQGISLNWLKWLKPGPALKTAVRFKLLEMIPDTQTMKYNHPLSHYARLYGRSLTSIKRYSSKSAPLDDPEAMRSFLAIQKDTGRTGKQPPAPEGTYTDDLEAVSELFCDLQAAINTARGMPENLQDLLRNFSAAVLGIDNAFHASFRAAGVKWSFDE